MAESCDDNSMFEDLLRSIGIENFDPMVPVALNDYARRFASELLCDAKDYANHRQSADIDVQDLNLALRMSDVRVTGVDPRDHIVQTIKDKINKKDLLSFADKDAVLIRYPKEMFMQRSHTFVPGHEAYDLPPAQDESQEMEITTAGEGDNSIPIAHNTGGQQSTAVPLSGILKFTSQTATKHSTPGKRLETAAGFSEEE